MSTYAVTFRRRARRDLHQIASYIASDNLDAALRFTHELETTCLTLMQFPARHPIILGTPDVRRLIHDLYGIYYRIQPAHHVIVLRIIHSARDFTRVSLD